MDKDINVNIKEILKTIKEYRNKNYDKGSEGYEVLSDIYCLLVTIYIYKGW